MEIFVQQKHIDEGQPGKSNDCAIARALKDMGHERVYVSGRYAEVDGKMFDLDMDGRRFVFMFDHAPKEVIRPIKLTLSPYHPDGRELKQQFAYAQVSSLVMQEGVAPQGMVTMDYTKWHKPMMVSAGSFSQFDYKIGVDTAI